LASVAPMPLSVRLKQQLKELRGKDRLTKAFYERDMFNNNEVLYHFSI